MPGKLTAANITDRAARKFGSKHFISWGKPLDYKVMRGQLSRTSANFRDTRRASNAIAASMRGRLGVREGDRVALVGAPHATKGEIPVAFIQLKEGEEASEEEFLSWCREHIAAYKAPRMVRIVDEMPLTMTLKVLKRELRKRLEQETAEEPR